MSDTPDAEHATEGATTDEQTPALAVENLTHAFGDVAVFSDVDFSVEPGTVTAVVGLNGSGKTTLLRAVLGLISPERGEISLPDAETTGRHLGYLPQSPAFRSQFTARETLAFYAALLDAEVDVPSVLQHVGLGAVADRRVDALSGGMVRLLGIGQAILGRPPVVILDEPTGDLDPRMTEYVFDVIGALAADGMAVLLATHDLSGAADADQVLLLDRGSIAARGSPAELCAETDTENFRAAFLALTGGEAPDDETVQRPVRTASMEGEER
jgi:ABC-type multidrug transport system ATPase subunit